MIKGRHLKDWFRRLNMRNAHLGFLLHLTLARVEQYRWLHSCFISVVSGIWGLIGLLGMGGPNEHKNPLEHNQWLALFTWDIACVYVLGPTTLTISERKSKKYLCSCIRAIVNLTRPLDPYLFMYLWVRSIIHTHICLCRLRKFTCRSQ